MTKPSRRSSVASALFRARPLRLALPALAVLVGFGLFVSGCGDDPAPTTPTPAPTPTPTPTAPGVPTGLEVASTGPDYIEWTWTAVTGATAYDVQMSNTAENDFTATTTASDVTATSRRFDVPAETTRWARVRAKSANGESDWSDAVSGTTMKAAVVLTTPTGLRVADRGHNFIEWTWNVVTGATAYEVQTRMGNANFSASDETANSPATASPKWRLTATPDTTYYARVRAVAGTGADKVEGDWALAVEGTSLEQPIGVPTGLEVTATGVEFIEWEWDAVTGATSYTWQLDVTAPYNFNPPSSTGQATATKHRASLDPGQVAHLRVRANIGVAPDQRRGEWSAGVSGTTEEPPVEPIGTPTGLDASGPTRSRVSLDWNNVENAENYEVEQRAGSGSWVDATCDESNDNEPEDSECTATDLESGTEYQFRVRAVPVDDDDDLLRESAWATVRATTTGRTTGGSGSGGGAGELNITWLSTANSITWNWDQAGRGVRYQAVVLNNVLDLASPCEDRSVNWTMVTTAPTSHTVTVTASQARLLCVRTATTDNDGETTYGTPSWSWAAAAPGTPTSPSGNYKDDLTGDQAGETDSLTWATVSFSDIPHFEYEFRYIVDEVEKDTDDWTTPDVTAEQRTCDAADVTETIEPSGSGRTTFTSNIDLEPYAAYRMCYRVVNDDGESDWAHSFAAPAYTRPIKPAVSVATITNNHNSAGEQGNTHFRAAWKITANTNAPRVANSDGGIIEDYAVVMVRSNTPQTDETVRGVCQTRSMGAGATPGFLATAATADHIRPPSRESSAFDVYFTFLNADANSRAYYYVCARTKDVRGSTEGQGTSPWVVSQGRAHGGSN